MAFDGRVLAVKQRRAADHNPSLEGLYHVGVAASVIEQTTFDGIIRLMVKGLERVAIVQLAEGQFLTAEVAPVEESRGQETDAFDLSRIMLDEFRAYCNANLSEPRYATNLDRRFARLSDIRQPGELADAVTELLAVGIDQRQDLLETSDVISRLEEIIILIKVGRQAA